MPGTDQTRPQRADLGTFKEKGTAEGETGALQVQILLPVPVQLF